MLDGGGGAGGVERVGRSGKMDKCGGSHSPVLPPSPPPRSCLLNASTHDISPLGRNGIFQFQMSAKEKGPRLKFSLNGQPEKKKKNEAASRLGTPLLPFFFPCSIHHSLAAGTPGQRQLLTFPSRLPAVAGPGSVAAQLSPRWLSPRPVAVACLIGHWGSPSDPLTGA